MFKYNLMMNILVEFVFKIYKTAFFLAIEKRYIEIIKFLLKCDTIDINLPYRICLLIC